MDGGRRQLPSMALRQHAKLGPLILALYALLQRGLSQPTRQRLHHTRVTDVAGGLIVLSLAEDRVWIDAGLARDTSDRVTQEGHLGVTARLLPLVTGLSLAYLLLSGERLQIDKFGQLIQG